MWLQVSKKIEEEKVHGRFCLHLSNDLVPFEREPADEESPMHKEPSSFSGHRGEGQVSSLIAKSSKEHLAHKHPAG